MNVLRAYQGIQFDEIKCHTWPGVHDRTNSVTHFLQGALRAPSKEESRRQQEISGAPVLQSALSQSAVLTDILLEAMHMITKDLIS